MITSVDSAPLAMDSSLGAERHLVEKWRSMSAERKPSAGTRLGRLPGDFLIGSVVSEELDPIDVALRVTGALHTLGVGHTIGGSIASSVAGEPRSTIDIDVIGPLPEARVLHGGSYYLWRS